MLVVLAMDPNAAVNRLMGTSSYDEGMFWSIPIPGAAQKIATFIGLAIAECFYLSVLLNMLFWRKESSLLGAPLARWLDHRTRSSSVHPRVDGVIGKWTGAWQELTDLRGARRKYWVGSRPNCSRCGWPIGLTHK